MMAYYAFLDEDNIVTEVISGVDEDQLIEGQDPESWYANFRNQVCKRTSYNTKMGKHEFGGIPFRKNYAGVGYFYDETRDAFIPPKPFPSWILNEQTCFWDAPKPRPNGAYVWDETQLDWVEIDPQP